MGKGKFGRLNCPVSWQVLEYVFEYVLEYVFDYVLEYVFVRHYTCLTHQGNQIWKRHMHPNVHRSTVYNNQDREAT